MLLIFLLFSSVVFAAEAPKGSSTLGTETNTLKIQELLLTTDYEKMTEKEYIAAIKNLGTLIRATDIASDKGKKDFAVLFGVAMNFSTFLSQGGLKNFTKEKQNKDIDGMIANLKTIKKADLKGPIDQMFPIDEAKIKAEYQRTQAVKASYKKSMEPTKENLIAAVHDGRTDIVEALIKARVDVNIKDKNNLSPLMDAARNDNAMIVKLLIDAKADVNAKDADNNTALISVAGADRNNANRVEIAKLLLAAKAKVNEKNKNGLTALIAATNQENTDIVKMLIAAKADVTLADSDGYTALKTATSKGNTEIADLLKKAGAKE